jgi:plastocyanin
MRKVLAGLVVVTPFLFVSNAGAAGWTVWAGPPVAKPPATAPKSTDLDSFLPGTLAINAGDSVTFRTHSFHTISFGGPRIRRQLPFIVPDPRHRAYSGILDAENEPFFFDGLAVAIYNQRVLYPFPSSKLVVSDQGIHSSGIISPFVKRPSATFTFPKPGTYHFYCLIHPYMRGTIRVAASGAPVPSADTVKTRVTKRFAADIAAARRLAKVRPKTRNIVYAGVGKGGVDLLAFSPRRLTVEAGTTVAFVNHDAREVHNEAFGPVKWVQHFDVTTDLIGPPGSPDQVTPVFIYGSQPAPYFYSGFEHGNGFLATPITDGVPHGPPQAVRVTFTRPGTYHFFCMIHGPSMSGEIVVAP